MLSGCLRLAQRPRMVLIVSILVTDGNFLPPDEVRNLAKDLL